MGSEFNAVHISVVKSLVSSKGRTFVSADKRKLETTGLTKPPAGKFSEWPEAHSELKLHERQKWI